MIFGRKKKKKILKCDICQEDFCIADYTRIQRFVRQAFVKTYKLTYPGDINESCNSCLKKYAIALGASMKG